MTDIEIARGCQMKPIGEIAATAGISEKYLEPYGKVKAKADYMPSYGITPARTASLSSSPPSPHPCGGGEDHHNHRSGGRSAPYRKKCSGGEGGIALAEEVVRLCDMPSSFRFSYELDGSLEEKIEAIVKRVYRGKGVQFTSAAVKQIKQLSELGHGNLPICIAKTQYSFSDDATLLCAGGFYRYGEKHKGLRRCRVRCGSHRGYHDHAGASQGTRGGENRRGRQWRHLRAVLKRY